jgi:NAD(P)-dependent dehydrogenase (short-subunit alcohol dehydrogenase family)
VTAPLAGRRAVITGGGTGIGRGIAEALVAHGAEVALIGRRPEPLQATVQALRQQGGRAHAFAGDVRDRDAIGRAVQEAQRAMGGVDLLVNNAGIGGANACALAGPDRWDEIVRTNLDGVFFTTRAALPLLPDGGRIVSISSVLGRFGVPGYTAYCASKHGVIGFTKALALELAPRKITVNAICPGWVETEMAREGFRGLGGEDEGRKLAARMAPLNRVLHPDEIAGLVAYLASDDARSVTGQAIVADGGQVMP